MTAPLTWCTARIAYRGSAIAPGLAKLLWFGAVASASIIGRVAKPGDRRRREANHECVNQKQPKEK